MAKSNDIVRAALGDLDARLDHWRQTLAARCRIPSISASGFPPDEVRRSAQAVALPGVRLWARASTRCSSACGPGRPSR